MQVLEEIKTEEEVKRVCSGFGEANASDYGPAPADSGNVYGPGAGLAAVAAGAVGASGAPGAGTPSWASAGVPAKGGAGEGMGTGVDAAKIVAQISAQVISEGGVGDGEQAKGRGGEGGFCIMSVQT